MESLYSLGRNSLLRLNLLWFLVTEQLQTETSQNNTKRGYRLIQGCRKGPLPLCSHLCQRRKVPALSHPLLSLSLRAAIVSRALCKAES